MAMSQAKLEELGETKAVAFKAFLACEPPNENGEDLLRLWDEMYDEDVKNTITETETGPSDDKTNPVFPYEKLWAIVGNGGNWKWPRMWQRFDELERRGAAYRPGEKLNFDQPSKNPDIVSQRVLVVGGGPCGLRLAIELVLGGHKVTIFEKRREMKSDDGTLTSLGFTNRINRPHMWNFVRNDLVRLNGKDFLSRQAAYPVFTEPETSSIGIDELQILLLKNALLIGVDFRLGVGFDNAKVAIDPKTCRPTWRVECSYDAEAAAKQKVEPGKQEEVFDCLVGCDGPRSAVRATQQAYFGDIEKRKFMDCVGIVANVRKVPRKRLKELGFEFGQEPSDMNRTKMVFRDFFDKIREEADAELESLIYYKASFHNYIILTPKKETLEKHGLSGKVYTFAAGREAVTSERQDDKAKLKAFCVRVLKAAGIPLDEEVENGGFVDAPNDCMAFDFAECWNMKKSINYNLPPPDYDVDKHGPWMGKKLVPMIGLAGDALLEPFWPMGLGLKRGWQALFDTCYCIDNLYNRTLLCERLGKDPRTHSWDAHYEALHEQVAKNFEYCSRLLVSDEQGKGEYDDKGVVMTQLKKKVKDAERPMFLVEIDPWTRYKPLEKEAGDKWKLALKETSDAFLHPKVKRALAMMHFYAGAAKSGSKTEIEYSGKKAISVNGRAISSGAAATGGYEFQPVGRRYTLSGKELDALGEEKEKTPASPVRIPIAEVAKCAQEKQKSLMEAVMASKIDQHVEAKVEANTGRVSGRRARPPGRMRVGTANFDDDDDFKDKLAHVAPAQAAGEADRAQAMWDRMQEKHLTPAQEAELAHVRGMISALMASLERYKLAEKEILLTGKLGSLPQP